MITLFLGVLILTMGVTSTPAGSALPLADQPSIAADTPTATQAQAAQAQAGPQAAEHYVGWVVGQSDSGYAAIFRSTDGGATWERQGSPATIPDAPLQAVAAIDPLTCWAVGESANGYGTILRTEDGGATWERQGSPATIPDVGLGKISAVDRDTAWVVGTPGVILFTADGGATWTQKQTADIPPVLLQGVYALDADNVWVTGDTYGGYGTIFRTEDGGASWQRKGSAAEVPDAALLDVHASDYDTAWIASAGALGSTTASVIHTDDNGASWTGQILVAFFDTNGVTTIGDNVVWVVTDADGIYRSDNARDFVQQQAAAGKYSYYLVSIDALDADTAWAAGPAGGTSVPAGIVEHTSDGGETWVKQLELDIALQAVSFARPQTYYFAEGHTGAGFQEYLCLGNFGTNDTTARVTYMFEGGGTQEEAYTVPAESRLTVNVNQVVGAGKHVAMECEADWPIVAERPMYFDYTGAGGHWTGGHDVMGAPAPANEWYFAEGYTGPGFDEYLCVLNPWGADADLTFRFQVQGEGERVVAGKTVPGHSRRTFRVNELLGGAYEASLDLESTQPVVAERSMYFNYTGYGAPGWTGGHCVIGATELSTDYLFAEGCTREGFDEYLILQNPNGFEITVYAFYMLGEGQGSPYPIGGIYTVPANGRKTVYVNSPGPEGVGGGKDVSVMLICYQDFLAERPMYFDYSGMGPHSWTGGHCVAGATAFARTWFFAEGYTGTGFEDWICIQNPGNLPAEVTITYFTESGDPIVCKQPTIAAFSRFTAYVNGPDNAGPGRTVSAMVTSDAPVICERPMYFSYGPGWTGGHCVMGSTP
ncbi:MAG: YCF48-related protein [Actinomycetota bacterium]